MKTRSSGVEYLKMCRLGTHYRKCALQVLLCVTLYSSAIALDEKASESYEFDFGSFVNTFGKQYESDAEWTYRFTVWNQNKDLIAKHNIEADAGLHSYTMGMNQFGDMTTEEYASTMLTYQPRTVRNNNMYKYSGDIDIPDSVDWKAQGYVTEVGNQGQCGSCWAFTATGALEGQHKKKTGTLVDLSEQNLMDCSSKQGNNGCEGGLMDSSYKYVKENGGIDTEQSYPYNLKHPGTFKCHYKRANIGATCTGYVDLPVGNETVLNEAVATIGPIGTAIDASHSGFQLYKSGVYDDTNCNSRIVDHSLVVTGYGVEDGKEYWDCKNSWGTQWGNQGYIRMVRNKQNQCGIANEASYPTV